MNVLWHRRAHPELPSDRGLLELASEPELPLYDAVFKFRMLVSSDMDWVHRRKARFRARASWARVLTLLLTASSTVVLGFTWLTARASIALPMVALVTVISALEPFFNWRYRWILMEETQYRLQRLRDEMDYYLVTTPKAEARKADFDRFFREQQKIWAETSRRWIEYRRLDPAAQDHAAGGSAG